MRAFALALPVIGSLMLIGVQAQAVEEHHRAAPAPGTTQATSSAPGPGMMGGMMGPGMMGQGMMNSGMMGGMACPMMGERDLSLDPAKARVLLQAHLIMMGNNRLQVGAVEAHGDHIAAEIQTVDGSLVQRLIVDPRTGHMRHAQ